jgi:hypothetical protein
MNARPKIDGSKILKPTTNHETINNFEVTRRYRLTPKIVYLNIMRRKVRATDFLRKRRLTMNTMKNKFSEA